MTSGKPTTREVLELLGGLLRVVHAVPKKKSPGYQVFRLPTANHDGRPIRHQCWNVETLHNRPLPNLEDIYS